jgi:hypothetical protein
MSTHHPDSSGHSVRGTAGRREKTRREVMCKICLAVYVPAQTHRQLARSPHTVIESAFMSMCHFCFRCRQPACPSCWDDVHEVCGACALEAQLPFRSSVLPLDGVVVPPVQHLPSVRVRTVTPPLVCVRPGRFQRAPLPIEAQTTLYVPTVSDQSLDAASKRYPSQKTPLPPPKPRPHVLDIIADVVTRPEKQSVHSNDTSRKASHRRHKPEHTVTRILLLIVLLIAIFFVSALLFPGVNDGIVYVLHVDIRAEIAYLLDLIQHLF